MLNSFLSILKSDFLFFRFIYLLKLQINSQINESKTCQTIALEMTVFDQKEFINNDLLLTFYFIPNPRLLYPWQRPFDVKNDVSSDKIPTPLKTFPAAHLDS